MLLRLENIEKSYKDNFEEKALLNGINLKIRDNDIVTVFGNFRSWKNYVTQYCFRYY